MAEGSAASDQFQALFEAAPHGVVASIQVA